MKEPYVVNKRPLWKRVAGLPGFWQRLYRSARRHMGRGRALLFLLRATWIVLK